MIQGWYNEDYLILFDEHSEATEMYNRYAIASFLPDYFLVGLKSWDDFILRDAKNHFFTVPTVPIAAQHIQPFAFDVAPSKLRADQRFIDKIRWFVKPLVFGGDPREDSNTTWITVDEHVEVVKWWNQMYRDLQKKSNT